MYNLVSLTGIFILVLIAWGLSVDRKAVRWKTVLSGVLIQIAFAFLVFRFPPGRTVMLHLNGLVVAVLESASAGSEFLFGRLALPPGATNASGEQSLGFILAFQALPTVVFFSSLMALLYYLGVLPRLIGLFARLFSRLMSISGAESLCTAGNIFVGVESVTAVRPYLMRMTNSELCTVLAAGMSTIASSVLAFYVFILKGQFPSIAGHLISASVLSAPAAVVMSKLLVPETSSPVTLGVDIEPQFEKDASATDSVIRGANEGLKLLFGITAMLIAFLGLMSLVDMLLAWLSAISGLESGVSLAGILKYIFYPFTLIVGVPSEDAMEVAKLIGQRLIVTEVKSYQDLASLLASGGLHNPRSAFIAAYALCGFAHVASLAIFVGGYSALVPERTADISSQGLRGLLAANLACLMTAAVAGLFYSSGDMILAG
ncbi:NupC/NupG family nucleoside CNT transporter [Nitrospirota bacterium]